MRYKGEIERMASMRVDLDCSSIHIHMHVITSRHVDGAQQKQHEMGVQGFQVPPVPSTNPPQADHYPTPYIEMMQSCPILIMHFLMVTYPNLHNPTHSQGDKEDPTPVLCDPPRTHDAFEETDLFLHPLKKPLHQSLTVTESSNRRAAKKQNSPSAGRGRTRGQERKAIDERLEKVDGGVTMLNATMVTFVVLLLLNTVGAQSRLTTYCEPQGGVYQNQRGKREKKELLDSSWAGEEVPILHSGYIHVIKNALGEIDVSPLFTNITTEEMLKKDKLKNEMQRVLQEENYEQAASIKKELFRLRQSSVIPQEAWDSLSEYTDSTQDSCTADSIASKTGRVWKSMVEGMQIFWEHASKFGDNQLEIILPALISGHDSGKPQPVSLECFIPEASSFDRNRQFKPFFTADRTHMGGSPTKATSLLSSLSFPYITSSMSTTQNNTIVRLKGASNMVWALGENSGMLHTLSCLTDEWQRRCELYPQYPFGDLAKVTEDHNEPGISWLPWTGVDWFEKVAQKAGALLLAGKLSKTQHRTAIEKVILSG
eukprot:752303-Hanusia_phi.AAC.10